jgi:hypothetical protein
MSELDRVLIIVEGGLSTVALFFLSWEWWRERKKKQ